MKGEPPAGTEIAKANVKAEESDKEWSDATEAVCKALVNKAFPIKLTALEVGENRDRLVEKIQGLPRAEQHHHLLR